MTPCPTTGILVCTITQTVPKCVCTSVGCPFRRSATICLALGYSGPTLFSAGLPLPRPAPPAHLPGLAAFNPHRPK